MLTLETLEKIVQGLGISFEALFERVAPGANPNSNIAAKCYDLLDSLPPKEQQFIWDIVLKIAEYKKL